MASLSFKDAKGKAVKGHETFAYTDGEQTVRLVGGILPRYVYWVKGTNNKDVPIECLAFNREKEKFDNAEVDLVPKEYPGLKCNWAYSMNCIDPKDGKVKVINLKKKLFEQIQSAAEDLGDPTDVDSGWDCVFKRAKTGPLPFNVEYQLQVLRCKKRPLTDAEREAVNAAEPIEAKLTRPGVEDIRALITKLKDNAEGDAPEGNLSASEREGVQDL